MIRTVVAIVGGLAVAVAVTTASTAAGARTYSTPATAPLATAFEDPTLFSGGQRPMAFALARAAGATYVRLQVAWRSIAPAAPHANFVATDPTSPGYNWAGIDAVVKDAAAAGLTPILDLSYPPFWAYSHPPDGVNAGSPKVTALGDFATALATHYDGSTPSVPAEHVFQVWNEPNLSLELSPVKASTYRSMVNAVANAVHAVDSTNFLVAGALEPIGHPKSKDRKWYSQSPLAFMRSLLCVSKGAHPRSTCHNAVHFDAWSHHPYTHGGPFGRATKPDNVELGDLPRMRALLRAGVRLHHVLSARPVQFWVTEFAWDTNPPRPTAASLSLASRWTAESLYQMWRSGVSLVTWWLLQDYPSPSPFQSGFYFHSPLLDTARPKPTLTAFRFPFVAYLKGRKISVWGRDATSDQEAVTIQLRRGKHGTWRRVALIESNRNGIFRATMTLKASKKDAVRAVAAGSETSLAFSLTRPKAPYIGPWGK